MIDLNKNIKPILALIVVILGFSYFYMCSIRNIKPDPQILIAVVSSIGVAIGYYFGSSSSGNKPNETQPTVTNAKEVNIDQTKKD